MKFKVGDRIVLNHELCIKNETYATILEVDKLGYLIRLLYTDGVNVEGWQHTDSIHRNWTIDAAHKFNQDLTGLIKE